MKNYLIVVIVCLIPLANIFAQKIETYTTDVCVYGASPAGIFAAIAVARTGKNVIIVEPTHKIAGLLGSGFRMQQDAPTGEHLGGLTGFYYKKDVALPPLKHYQAAEDFNISTLNSMINKYGDKIKITKNHRLFKTVVADKKITEANFEYAPANEYGVPAAHRRSEDVLCIKATVFIDASYEGDLMAQSGVSYRIGKESKTTYGESLAGIIISQKFPGIDPYKEAGNPKSGLLAGISSDPIGNEGDSSRYFMGYNFKLAWERNPTTKNPGIKVGPPEKKDKDLYELLNRYVKAGYHITWPEENFFRGELLTGAYPGTQLGYPDGNWEERSKIWQSYIDHIKTLTDFTKKDFRFISGINSSSNGWPFLYIRGGRRMIGEYVLKQEDIQLQTDIKTPICLGYYNVDIYPNRLVVLSDGTLAQEGNVFEMISPGPYQIPYASITPKRGECTNLLVPLCLSASHVAYSSVRMEATYMAIGESAGIAASLAIDEDTSVQQVNPEVLTERLINSGQILHWDGMGFNIGWRSNIFGIPEPYLGRWESHPEEYIRKPISVLRKHDNQYLFIKKD